MEEVNMEGKLGDMVGEGAGMEQTRGGVDRGAERSEGAPERLSSERHGRLEL